MVEGGGVFGGETPLSLGAHLQPGNSAFALHLDLSHDHDLAHLHSHHGFTDDERAEAEMARDRVENLLRDDAMVAQLREQGFQGLGYEVFQAAVASYGFAVMRALIRRGEIFRLTADRKRPVRTGPEVREHLASPSGDDDRQELAMETVATALPRFREDALLNGRWSIQGGASVNTFFIGSCILAFANVFRAWLTNEFGPRRHLRQCDMELQERPNMWGDSDMDADPADTAVRNSVLRSALDLAPNSRVRQIVGELAFTAREYSELAEKVGMSEDAVKQAVFRFRQKALASRKEIAGE